MKNLFRFLATTFVLSPLTAVVVSIIGWLLGWNSIAQFSDGLFWSGCILVVLGLLIVKGDDKMRSNFVLVHSESAGNMSIGERSKRWVADRIQSNNSVVILLINGAFLMGLAILIPKIF